MNELTEVTGTMTGSLSEITVLFALVLALALLTERLLEVLKALYDMLDGWNDLYMRWTRKSYRIRDYAERKLLRLRVRGAGKGGAGPAAVQ